MFPIRDDIPSRGVPFVTWAIVLANGAAFGYELSLGPAGLQALFDRYALVPAAWSAPSPAWAALFPGGRPDLIDRLTPFVSSMFLHGGWMHVIANLWSLWIFGDNVEDRLGHLRYLAFYFFCGVMAAALHLFTNWGSPVPTIGASGAIAGVMGAYMLLFPRARVLTVIPIFFLPWLVEVPAVLYLFFWFFSQVYSGAFDIGARFGGIAWWAHIGGFLAGMYYVLRWLPRRRSS